jgi:surfeit locus 1 family protein
MLGMSRWQWSRHIEKQALIQTLQDTLRLDPIELTTLLGQDVAWDALSWRRVQLSGTFDFSNEVVLRHRTLDGRAGVHVITPLRLSGRPESILVDRGFIPLGRDAPAQRVQYQTPQDLNGFGLIKESVSRKFFAPADPLAGPGSARVDAWLRVDIPAIQKQVPYPLLPVYIELMADPNDPLLPSKIVRQSSTGRNDILAYTGQKSIETFGMDSPDVQYPIPTYDTTPPPDIHLGYVYEWIFLAALTVAIGALAQLAPLRRRLTRLHDGISVNPKM